MTQTVRLTSERNRRTAQQLIWQAPDGHVCRISAPRRSTEQNSRLWAMLSDIARAKPEGRTHTAEQWKAIFMRAAGHQLGYLNDLDGEPFPYGYRSSELSVPQMVDLQTLIEAFAAQHNIKLGDE